MCVCNSNGTFQHAALFHPGCARHFAVAVKSKCPGEDRFVILLPARVDDGHTGPCGFAFDHGGIPHGHAWNVCDGVAGPGCAFKRNPQIAGAWLGHASPPLISLTSWLAIPCIISSGTP